MSGRVPVRAELTRGIAARREVGIGGCKWEQSGGEGGRVLSLTLVSGSETGGWGARGHLLDPMTCFAEGKRPPLMH